MFRKIGFGAAAALTVGMLAVGCSEDGDTIITGGGTTRPGNFPGSQVDENNVAADARAFTPAGSEFEEGFHVFWNRANNQAIVLFEVEDTNNTTATYRLMASHYDGSRLSAPVQIRGNGNSAVEDPFSSVSSVKVLWLNTSGTIADKNGDAIILFTRGDQDLTTNPTNTSNEDGNVRLWMSYFNVSDRNAAPSGTSINGFLTSAVALDTDIQAVGADTNIAVHGFVSDSLHNTHQFTAGTDITDSGDPTSYVYVFYGKNTDTDTTTVAGTSPRFRFIALDLTATTLPTAGGTDLAIGAGTFDADEGADINQSVIVHNNAMIWESESVGNASGNDNVVTVTFFNTNGSGVGAVSTLNETLTANTDSATMPLPGNVWGGDHGLPDLVVFYLGSGYTDGAVGSRSGDTDAMVARFPLSSSTSVTPERAEIDNFQNVISAAIGGTRGSVNSIQTRISRPGNYILALMLGDNSDLTDATAPQAQARLYARAYQTQPAGTATTRTLANALTPVLTPPAIAATTAQDQADVTNVQFQEDLADGQGDRTCSFQGNHRRMNFLYQQLGEQAGAGTAADQNRLLVNGVVVTLDATGTAAPTATLVSTTEVEVDRADTGYGATYTARAFDAGDASTSGSPAAPTATAGRPIVFFISQDNNRADDDAPTTEFTEKRLYAWESGTVVTVSSNPTDAAVDFFQVVNLLDGVATPINENTQQTPDYVGTRLDIFWTEEETPTSVGGSTTSELDLGTRSYDLRTTAGTTTVAIADRFTPPTSAEASFIDDRSGSLLLRGSNTRSGIVRGEPLDGSAGYEGFTILRRGSTVGVVFDQENRIRYQETSTDGAGYYKSGSIFTPELVDNESDRSVLDYQVAARPRCENMADAMIFFLKMTDNAIDTTPRAQVRIKR